MADGHVFLAPNADRFFSRPRLVRTSSLPDLSKVHTDSTLVVANRISNQNMSTSVPDYGSLSSPGGDSHMKQTGMLVVSLRGVNFGFWSR